MLWDINIYVINKWQCRTQKTNERIAQFMNNNTVAIFERLIAYKFLKHMVTLV